MIGPNRYEVAWRSDDDRQQKLHPAEDVELAVPLRPLKFTDIGGDVRDVRHVIAASLAMGVPTAKRPYIMR